MLRTQTMATPLKALLKQTILYRLFKTVVNYRQFMRSVSEVGRWGEDDDKMLAFYGQLIKPGDLCFDVGANVGNRSKIFLRLGARVVAFEPQSECQEVLARHFADNERFTIVPCALGASRGKLRLYRGDANTISTLAADWIEAVRVSRRFGGAEWRAGEEVEVEILDDMIKRFGVPQFTKIDVEGFELDVLRGCSTRLPALSLEVTTERLDFTLLCMDVLESRGPNDYNLSSDTCSFECDSWKSCDEMRETLRHLGSAKRLWSGDLYIRMRPQ